MPNKTIKNNSITKNNLVLKLILILSCLFNKTSYSKFFLTEEPFCSLEGKQDEIIAFILAKGYPALTQTEKKDFVSYISEAIKTNTEETNFLKNYLIPQIPELKERLSLHEKENSQNDNFGSLILLNLLYAQYRCTKNPSEKEYITDLKKAIFITDNEPEKLCAYADKYNYIINDLHASFAKK